MNFISTYLFGPFADMAAYPAGVLETVIAGLGNGFLYALVAIGFVIIFKSSSVFNFAQGAMVFFAALNFAGMLKLGVPWYLAGAFSLLIMVALAFVAERVVLRPPGGPGRAQPVHGDHRRPPFSSRASVRPSGAAIPSS